MDNKFINGTLLGYYPSPLGNSFKKRGDANRAYKLNQARRIAAAYNNFQEAQPIIEDYIRRGTNRPNLTSHFIRQGFVRHIEQMNISYVNELVNLIDRRGWMK